MTEFDIQFEIDWEKYSIFRKGKRDDLFKTENEE